MALEIRWDRLVAAAAVVVPILGLTGCCLLMPEGITVDPPLEGEFEPNGVLEPGETVDVEPAWQRSNRCTVTSSETGTASDFTGPTGGTYTILDGTADYGTFTTRARCASTANCYRMSVSAATRPVQHWDASFLETLQPNALKRRWTLHIGESFADVPAGNTRYREIETMLHKGVAAGCTPADFCPDRTITRAEAATFIARAYFRGDSAVPIRSDTSPNAYDCVPGGVSLFEDLDPGDPSCKHVHALAREMDVSCAPGRFCPFREADRGTMAHLVAEFGGHFDVPVTYGPDPATGRTYSCADGGHTPFSDVGLRDPLCAPIDFLWAKGVIDGCTATEYCPGGPVTREAAAAFVVGGFGLKLYDGEAARTIPQDSCGSDTTLCTREGRFSVQAVWHRPDGSYGPGHAVSLSSESGYFWFFNPGNVEVVFKTPAGCAVNNHDWFFAAGLTDIEVDLRVVDRATGEVRTYSNPQGTPFRPITDTSAFAACGSDAAAGSFSGEVAESRWEELTAFRRDTSSGCVPNDGSLCLDGRFRVEADWRTGSAAPSPAHAIAITPDAGYFWFFDPSNVELVAKTVNACGLGQGEWFFAGGMTTAGVELRITDTLTGQVRTYSNPTGQPFAPVQDTRAFSFCPLPSEVHAAIEP
jgi:hypothetical protein